MTATTPIRLASGSDGAAIARIYAPIVRETPISFELVPPSVAEMTQRIEATLVKLPWLLWEEAGEVLGYAYADQHRQRAAYQWSVEVSVYIDGRARRRGVGTALYEALLETLCLQGYVTAFAGITLPNPASVALHERVGFVHLGTYSNAGHKQGRWYDVGWWQRSLCGGALPETPAPPVPLVELPELPLAIRGS